MKNKLITILLIAASTFNLIPTTSTKAFEKDNTLTQKEDNLMLGNNKKTTGPAAEVKPLLGVKASIDNEIELGKTSSEVKINWGKHKEEEVAYNWFLINADGTEKQIGANKSLNLSKDLKDYVGKKVYCQITNYADLTIDSNKATIVAASNEIDNTKDYKLEVYVDEEVKVGYTIAPMLTIKDSDNKQLAYGTSDYKCKWYLDNEEIGDNNTLFIKSDYLGKELKCEVTYKDQVVMSNVVTITENIEVFNPMMMLRSTPEGTNGVVEQIFDTSLGKVKVKYFKDNVNDYSSQLPGEKGFTTAMTGSNSKTNNDGVRTYNEYYALAAVAGQEITVTNIEHNNGGISLDIGDTCVFAAGRADFNYSGVSATFIMPNTKDFTIEKYHKGSHLSDSRTYETYSLIPITNVDMGNPTSEPALTVQQILLNYKASNNTTINELQSLANGCVDTSKFDVILTQTGKVAASESSEGSFSGKISVTSKTDSSKKTETNFTLQISKTGQSANTLMESYKKAIENFKGTNNTNQNDIVNLIVKTNNDISVSVTNFKKNNSSDKATGTITGTLNITGVPSYSFNIEIPKLAQSTSTAKTILEAVTKNMVVDNSTDQGKVQSLVNSAIDTSAVTANVSITEKINATETKKGTLLGNVAITDKTGAKADVPINREIETETQSLGTVKSSFEAYLNSMEKSNSTTEDDILNGVNITNEDISAKISDYKVVAATETTRGNIQGLITIEDNATGKSETVPINLIIDYLHQSPSTVAKLYEEASKSYIASNSTTPQDIIDMISITNKDITVTEDSFKLIPSTDESKGQVTVNLTISDGKTQVIQPIKIVIENQPQELATALAEVQKFLAEQKTRTTNDTDTDDLLIKINQAITNSKIFVSYSNAEGERIEKVNATEDTKGYIKGQLLLADDQGHKVKVPVDLEIAKLSQGLDNAETKVRAYLDSLKGTNTLKDTEVLFGIQELLDSSITAEIKDYKVDVATESSKGLITGKVILNKDGESREIPINIEINLQAQSMENAINLINAKLKDMYLTNISTAKDLETELSKCLTGAEGNKIKVKISDDDFRMMKATLDAAGSVRGKITLFDSNMNIEYIPYNVPIKQLAQTLEHAISKIEEKLDNLKATNKLTKEVFTADMQSVITNADGSKITITIDKFELMEATEKTSGKLDVQVTVSDGKSNKTLGKVYEIAKTNQSVEDAQDTIDKIVLPNIKVDNNTTAEDIKNQIQDAVGDNINVDIKDFKKDESSNKEDGKITGTVIITDKNTGEKVEIPIEITIPKIEQTLDEAQDTIDKVLPDIKVDNNTTEEDIKDQIKDSVGGNIDVDIDNFNKDDATEKEDGKITGDIIITDKNTGEQVKIPIEITIPKLEPSENNSNGGGGSSYSESKNQGPINIGNNVTSIENLYNMLDNSDISILGISRDNLLSNVTVDKINKVTESDNIEFEGINSAVSKVDLPYKEIKATDGKILNGDLSVIIADNKIIGMSIKGQENYGKNTNIRVATKLPEDNINIYTKIKDIDKYLEVKEKSLKEDNGIVLQGINNDNYLITTKRLSEKKQANQGWYKSENEDWVYINDYAIEKGWIYDNSGWYFNDLTSGKMKTGWLNSPYSNKWYYLNEYSDGTKGKMQTGWLKSNDGNWYYLNSDGSMAKDTYIDGYYLDNSGKIM